MYGAKNQQLLSAGVLVETSKDSLGQQLQANLEDQLNPGGVPAQPLYSLSVQVASGTGGIGVARDGTISRYNVALDSSYVLTRLSDRKIIQTGNIRHVSSFNNQVNQYYSTYIAEKDAMKRGLTELAELYRQRLGVLLLKNGAT